MSRLSGFITISIALHLLTVVGVSRLDPSARRFGDAPARFELHATLVPGAESAPAAPPAPPARTEIEPTARDTSSEPAPSKSSPRPEPTTEQAALALPAPDKWYTAQEVDVHAQPLAGIPLSYPENLREAVSGKVRLRVFIDERGVVRKIQVAASEPHGVFDESARKAWENVRFSPAIKNGERVKSQKLLELTYQPGLM